jgi:hypothetical protein
MSNDTTTPEQEVNDAPEETVNEEQVTEETVGSFQEEEKPKENKVPDSIPKARFDEVNEKRKDLQKQLDELTKEKDADSTVSDTEKDPEVKELAKQLAEIQDKDKKAQEKLKRVQRDAALTDGLNKALETAPEFKDIANADVIKQMALNPANKDKTFVDLLEEAYGNALGGRRTIETTTPRGGAKDTKVDIERTKKDTEYRREVLANPDLKKQYNESIEDRIPL